MIDNIEFTKFVIANKPMSEEEKMEFLEAVPKMTEEEKAFFIVSIRQEQAAELNEEIEDIETKAILSGEDVDKAVEDFMAQKIGDLDKEKIESIRENLRSAPNPEQKS